MPRLARRAAIESRDVMNEGLSVVHVNDSSSNVDTENPNLQSMFTRKSEEVTRIPRLAIVWRYRRCSLGR